MLVPTATEQIYKVTAVGDQDKIDKMKLSGPCRSFKAQLVLK